MIPINIAVTGHRNISGDEINNCKFAVQNILKDMKMKYKYSTINILTGLADGADLLVAEEALELGCDIIVTLPFNKEEYIATISTDNQIRFNAIVKRAKRVIDVSKYNTNAIGDERYEELGIYLVKHAQLIIALWDGIDNGKTGGTSDVVKYALKGIPYKKRANYQILDMYDNIPVYHVLTSREKQSCSVEEIDYLVDSKNDHYQVLYAKSWGENGSRAAREHFESILKKMDTYNKDSIKVRQDEKEESLEYLLSRTPREVFTKDMNTLFNEYAVSDVLATKYQNRTVNLVKLLLVCGFLVFFWVTLFDEVLSELPNLLFLVPLFFGITYFVYKISQNKSVEAKYYEYRAFSESLRVQIFWKMAYLKENTYASYPRKNENDLGWIIDALSNISLQVNDSLFYEEPDDRQLFILSSWVKDQLDFYKKRYHKVQKIIKRQKRIILGLFILAITSVIGLYVVETYVKNDLLYYYKGLRSLCLFSFDTLLAIGAVFSGYLENRQYDSQSSQYIRMMKVYEEGTKEYLHAISNNQDERINSIIKEIGIEAICENADWVAYNRKSNMEMPLGM